MRSKRYQKQNGFTLLEIAIAVTILVVITIGVGELITNLFQIKSNVVYTADADTVLASMTKWIETLPGCNATFQGKVLPATPTPFSFTGFTGFGSTGGAIQANTSFGNQLTLSQLTIVDKGVAPTNITVSNIAYVQKIAQLRFVFQALTGQTQQQLHERFIEMPVLILANDPTNTINQCYGSSDLSQDCNIMGGTFQNGVCLPATVCVTQGSFQTVACNPTDPACPNDTLNPFTNAATCASGFTATPTGATTTTMNIITNKGKSNTPVNVVTQFFTCIRCCPNGICPP